MESLKEIEKRQIEGTITFEELKEWIRNERIQNLQSEIINNVIVNPKTLSEKFRKQMRDKAILEVEFGDVKSEEELKFEDDFSKFENKH